MQSISTAFDRAHQFQEIITVVPNMHHSILISEKFKLQFHEMHPFDVLSKAQAAQLTQGTIVFTGAGAESLLMQQHWRLVGSQRLCHRRLS
jgi:hypothetical protein